MDFKQYQYIIRVAEHGSVTKAAQSLYISQPSLSAFIAKTEEELGTALFRRDRTSMELTMAGEIFVEAGRRILAKHEDMKMRLMQLSENKIGKLQVGIPGSRAAYMLPIIYPVFRASFPGIELEILESASATLIEKLQRGDIDLSIMPRLPDESGLSNEMIYQEELFLIARKGYLQPGDYAGEGFVDAARLEKYPFVLLKAGHGVRRKLDNYFREVNLSPRILFETSNNATALRMASIGEGLAVVPRLTLEMSSDTEDIQVLRLGEKGLFWDIVAVRLPASLDNYIQNEFIRITQEVFRNRA